VKVLFLDIDGVLNSSGWTATRRELGEIAPPEVRDDLHPASAIRGWHDIDPEAVARLQRIVDAPFLASSRGDEIRAWLAARPDVEAYAVVDDNDDGLEAARFVPTWWEGEDGLADVHVDAVIALLGVITTGAAHAPISRPRRHARVIT
jgi:hypothetical protein